MKTFKPFRYFIVSVLIVLTGVLAMAQDAGNEQKKQQQMEQEQMKAMQAEEMYARKKMLEEQQQKMQQLEQEYNIQANDYMRQARESSRAIVRSGGVHSDGDYFIVGGPQGSQSQLTLRKNFRETTSMSKGEFDVESGITQFRCMISGSVRAGEIYIGIEYPDGKVFKELVINPSADINFSKSISVKEEDQKKFKGDWSYVIKADKAEGNYMVQIMTN